MTLTNKTMIVTGASGGMGKAATSQLLEAGANVVGCDLNTHALDAFKDHDRFVAFEGNVLEEDTARQLFQKALDQFGSVDGLANILGIAQSATPIEDITLERYQQLMDVNMTTVFLTCREAAKHMKPQQQGKIVNIGSVSTTRPRPGLQAYVASKGAVESFTKTLALELAPYHINANVLHPGPADTTMLGQFSGDGANVDEAKKEVFEKSVPLGRLLKPDDIAHSVKFLLSDDAAMITGSVLHVDGGRNI